jgi:hypothetical protein
MLFVFRTLNFFALGVIFLTPFWLFNSTLDRLLPHATSAAPPRVDAATTRLREQVVTTLSTMKNDIRADMCRRDARAICLLTICAPFSPGRRCP